MISILHPSRGRPEKSWQTVQKFMGDGVEIIVSIDEDDSFRGLYFQRYGDKAIINSNRSAVDAINSAAKVAKGDVFFVVSDDTDCEENWYDQLMKVISGKEDFILKTQDGIQNWILTNPILDRKYYQRFGYVYDPDFRHQFVDTWMSVQADISGRKLTSNLMFRHLNDSIKDDVRKRSDATWDEGQRTFIQKLKQTPIEDLRKITDQSMKNWIRNYAGIRL